MKILKNLLIVLLALGLAACNNDKPGSRNVDVGPAPTPITPGAINGTPTAPAPGNATVFHYQCMNGCVNSGSSTAGTCPNCGNPFTHNQAWHNLPQNAPATPTTPTTPTTPGATPAMNAAGVYHYTCPNGCSGGAGSAQACASCGTVLAHNAAYHNQPGSTTPSFSPVTPQPGQKSPLYVN
ncbi:MAG: hypothetical protein AAF242_04295 [Bacteroidota bacterium]